MAGFWQHSGYDLYVSESTVASTYQAETENDVYLRSFTMSGLNATSTDYHWAGTWAMANAPTLTGTWNTFDSGGNGTGPVTLTATNENAYTDGSHHYAIKSRTSTSFTAALLNTTTILTYNGTQLTGFASGDFWTPQAAVFAGPHSQTVTVDWQASATNELYGVWSVAGQGYLSVTKSGAAYATSPVPGDGAFGTLSISGTAVTSIVTAGTSTGVLSGQTLTWATGPLASQVWTADWVVSGYYLYRSTTWPYARMNAKALALTSDRSTATVTGGATQTVAWADGSSWATTASLYTATLDDNTLTWNAGPVWTAFSLVGGVVLQTLALLTDYQTETLKYSRTQAGTLMHETYLAKGLTLTESGTGDKGTYDPTTGKISWKKPDGSASTMGA